MNLNDLLKKAQDFIGQAGNSFNQGVVQPVQREIQQAPQQFSQLEQQVKNFGVGANNFVQNSANNIGQFGLNNAIIKPLQMADRIGQGGLDRITGKVDLLPTLKNDTGFMNSPKATIAKGGYNLLAGIGNSIASEGIIRPVNDLSQGIADFAYGNNIDRNSFKSGAFKLGSDIANGQANTQQVLGDIGQTLMPIINAWGGGKVLNAFEGKAMKEVLAGKFGLELQKQAMKAVAIQSAKQGAKVGGAYGLAQGAYDNQGQSLGQDLLNTGVSGAAGAIMGGVIGGITPYAGRGVSNIISDVKQKINPTKRIVTKYDYAPNYGAMIDGKPQQVPIPESLRKVVETQPFEPKSLLFKGIKKIDGQGGMSIKDVSGGNILTVGDTVNIDSLIKDKNAIDYYKAQGYTGIQNKKGSINFDNKKSNINIDAVKKQITSIDKQLEDISRKGDTFTKNAKITSNNASNQNKTVLLLQKKDELNKIVNSSDKSPLIQEGVSPSPIQTGEIPNAPKTLAEVRSLAYAEAEKADPYWQMSDNSSQTQGQKVFDQVYEKFGGSKLQEDAIKQHNAEAYANKTGVYAPKEQTPVPPTNDYIKQLTDQQNNARQVEKGGIVDRTKGFLADVKRKLVDSTAPIEDTLFSAQKKGQYEVLPKYNIHDQIDRVSRSRELASQFATDNGLVDVIKQTPNMDELNQYLIAKHTPEVATQTGRNAQADSQLVKDLAPTYEPYAQKVIQYGQKLLDYATETGLVSKESATALKQKYPNYVPLNRIFSELEQGGVFEGAKTGVANLSKQSVVMKLKGSERAIQNPLESLLTKTADAFSQGERNIAGSQLASYRDLPGFEGLIKEVPKGENMPTHSFSFIDNGVKRTFETTPEIASAAKLLDKRQLGFVGQIFAAPVRVARVGITGLNIPFIGANIAKDQVSGFINSDKAIQTSVVGRGGLNFLESAWNAIGHGKEYQDWIRNAGGGTSFDISRSAPETSIAKIRAGRNVVSKIAYTVTHPSELFRMAENVVARGEELTRLQQFTGTKRALLAEGRTLADANQLGARQSREATVNFARSGDWGKALNSAFLYMNAGIQGSRTLVRNASTRPAATIAKIGLTVMTPLAVITSWNLSDPKRKAAYDDIRDYEKENNLVIVPPNPTQDPKTGKWNVIKIPMSQEIASMTIPMRKGMEALQGYDAPGFADIAKAFIGSVTPLNTQSGQALAGQFIPQAVKTPTEMLLNKSTFTGTDIVPQYLNGQQSKNLPPEMQVRSNTSGTAREIGGALGISPMKVEYGVKGVLGGVGSQILNASDQTQAAAGIIPKEQIGGQSITEGLTSRFNQATGGQKLTNLFDGKKGQASTGGAKPTDSRIVENKGTYYVSTGKDSVKSFDNLPDAQVGLNKSDFDKSGKNFQIIDGMVYRKNKQGNVQTPVPENDYNAQLYGAKLTSYKKNDDIKGWIKTADKQFDVLNTQLQDTTLDEYDKLQIQNKIDTLVSEYQKYAGYGGFTKPKAAKKAKALPKALQLTPIKMKQPFKISSPKISFSMPKPLNIRNVKSPKVVIKKPTLKQSYASIPGSKRLA